MKLIFAGSGSAFTTGMENFHSNMLLENSMHEHLMIDCGSDARLSLYQLGLTYRDIKHVYISHLHADHVGGLEWLGLRSKFDKTCIRPKLYIEPELVQELWNSVLAGGMSCLQSEAAALDVFFEPVLIQNHHFRWDDIQFETVKSIHIYNLNFLLPSYGLFFSVNSHKILITTDTRFQPTYYQSYYQEADWIFQDCETAEIPSGVHAHYNDLVHLPKKIKAKMWLYHYNTAILPDAKKDGFLGFVKRAQVFDLVELRSLGIRETSF